MKAYNFKEIEEKWQAYWAENDVFQVGEEGEKPRFYGLDMFPYPSGAGLHVGHPLGYIASDIYARYKRHKGYEVLHPMGYDSFGLPAEQYAIQTGQHPAVTTEKNVKRYRQQLDRMGLSFDWSRELRTSDPAYYKWTQWMFIQLFKSWYNIETDKAEAIETLIQRFEQGGNREVKAACDGGVPAFSAADWRAFSRSEKQELLLHYRLAYLGKTQVNWCPKLSTVLANDEVVNGFSERGGFPVVRKEMTQWNLRITAYAQRLSDGLKDLDWPVPIKDIQRNWIGRSQGARVRFRTVEGSEVIEVFTTRPDTIFGVNCLVLAPEHEQVKSLTTPGYRDSIERCLAATARKSERERMADVDSFIGGFTGTYVKHPFTQKWLQVWVGDYVLPYYGTGAVMAVPCGDQRDYEFAWYFEIPFKSIFKDVDLSERAHTAKEHTVLAQSEFLDGLGVEEATQKVMEALQRIEAGYEQVHFRLRDAVFSRQRYWGEPFPVYYEDGLPQVINEAQLPLKLPEIQAYQPIETGASPLGRAAQWAWDTQQQKVVATAQIDQKTVFPLEWNTMPGWAGSSWYFNRYMDAQNPKAFARREALERWRAVDLYIGGSEHATGHLLYSRFWQKFLYDRGWVPEEVYAKKLINQGMILGNSAFVFRVNGTDTFVSKNLAKDYETTPIHVDVSLVNASDELDVGGFKRWRPEHTYARFILEEGRYLTAREVEKMSKSKYNVVNPDAIIERYGADTLRMYEMFLGPIEQAKPWNTAGITGVHQFLKKLWRLYHLGGTFGVSEEKPTREELKTLHQSIRKVTEDIERFSFNTPVSALMVAVNEYHKLGCNKREVLEPLSILLSPYAPHLAEELWQQMGHADSITRQAFPEFNPQYLVEDIREYPILFNGKLRFKMVFATDASRSAMEKAVLQAEKTDHYLGGETPKRIVIVPGKVINVVC